MRDIYIPENQFNLKEFLESFIQTWQRFWKMENCMEVFMGVDKEYDQIFLHEEDIYEDTDDYPIKMSMKKVVDVVTQRIKDEGYAICFPFTNVFLEAQNKGYLTCADGKKHKLKVSDDEDNYGSGRFENPDAPNFYDLGCYGIMLRWEDDKWVCCGGLRHSADDDVEFWKKPWKEIDVPMEKFLSKFTTKNTDKTKGKENGQENRFKKAFPSEKNWLTSQQRCQFNEKKTNPTSGCGVKTV